jgi:prepilin peptidase CpaA
MLPHLIIFAPLVILLALAAGWDLASYTIPNFIPLIVLLSFALFSVAAGYTAASYETHALAALIALVVGFALFALEADAAIECFTDNAAHG